MKKHIIKEEWIKLENDLAEELLKADKTERASKYTDVYEKIYSMVSEEKRDEMSKNYLKGAVEFNKYLKRIIGSKKSILDLGCGIGHLSTLIAKDGNFVTGIDINRFHIKEAKELYGNIDNLQFFETSGVKLNFPDNSFDFVISTSVFEHIHPDDVNVHLSEIRRVLKDGGEYIFTAITPYTRGDISAHSKDPKQKEKTGFHINCRTWEELKKLLENNQFISKTNILPWIITSYFNFLIPISYKVFLEQKIKVNRITVILFKLGEVFIVANVKK